MKILISTVGTGSRLGKLTESMNKSLLSCGDKPMLSWILEKFSKDSEFVVATGFRGDLVKEYLSLAHPDLKIQTVDVFPYEGEGSGLGYSIKCCKKYLQEPFIFCPCDTLILDSLPDLSENWFCCARELVNCKNYRSIRPTGHAGYYSSKIVEKGETKAYPYTGLCGIRDYEQFWQGMESEDAVELGEVAGLRALEQLTPFMCDAWTWFDTGNPEGYQAACKALAVEGKHLLPKTGESIWFVESRVIKYSKDTSFIEDRVKRSEDLQGFIPELLGRTEHMYCYKYVEGTVLSDCITLPIFQQLLEFSQKLWVPKDTGVIFSQCLEFYRDKTLKRIQLFYDRTGKKDVNRINGRNLPSLEELLNKINWNRISAGEPVRFHGDFHFENILYREGKFTFLDWRQRFGNSLEVGDLYYDFAKLMHGLIVNHGLISEGRFSVDWEEEEINYSLDRKQILVQCERYFEGWLQKKGYDLTKVRVLTALIYLNICGLHEEPYGLMLYALGKEMLYDTLYK